MGDQVFNVIASLLRTVSTLLLEEGNLLGGLQEQIQVISAEFLHMKAFLEAMESYQEDDPQLKVWIDLVREAAFDTEDILDEFKFLFATQHPDGILGSLSSNFNSLKNLPARHRLATKLQSIKVRIQTISEAHRRYESQYGKIPAQAPGRVPANHSWRYTKDDEAIYAKEGQLVGIEPHKRHLVSLLLKGDSQLKVISVLGMGGIGKTTLVKQVHDDVDVKSRFQIRAWITVSQSYDLRELLKGLLRRLLADFNELAAPGMESMEIDELKTQIRNFLQRAMYAIVFDDVWNTYFWDEFKFAFPENSFGGNCVLLTTRTAGVASASCNKPETDCIYKMEFLSSKDSWTLFCRRTFRDNCCPDNLKNVAEGIVAKCEGLPLAIVAISGVLGSKDLSKIDEWERVHQRLLGEESEGVGKLDIAKKIIFLSYNDLPSALKSCLLFLGRFPEDYIIPSFNLIEEWIAERFVEQRAGQSSEDVGWGYLKELANRSLILIDEVGYNGLPYSFHVHDLLREVIVTESREKNFMIVVGTSQQQAGLRWPPEKVRHLAFHRKYNDLLDYDTSVSGHGFSNLRTLFAFDQLPRALSSSHLLSSKFLKVVSFICVQLEEIPKEIFNLFHLTHLNLAHTRVKIVPKSIRRLPNLEYLNLEGTKVGKLPKEILKLKKLRVLGLFQIFDSRDPDSRYHGFEAPGDIGGLSGLQNLQYVNAVASDKTEIVKVIGKMTQLRRLGIDNLRREVGKELCLSLEKLPNLWELLLNSTGEKEESSTLDLNYPISDVFLLSLRFLRLYGHLEKMPPWIASLQNLELIYLNWSRLTDDPLESLQHLPNLVEADLCGAYQAESLWFKAGGFRKLRTLDLREMKGFKQMRVEKGAMPNIKELYLRRLPLLEELPSGIEHLSQLQELEFVDVSPVLTRKLRGKEFKESEDYKRIAHIPQVTIYFWEDGKWDKLQL